MLFDLENYEMKAKWVSTLKTYDYKTEEDLLLHCKEMEGKGFRLWGKTKLGDRWTADYVKDRAGAT